jgi:seryl-tRNA synthetase
LNQIKTQKNTNTEEAISLLLEKLSDRPRVAEIESLELKQKIRQLEKKNATISLELEEKILSLKNMLTASISVLILQRDIILR